MWNNLVLLWKAVGRAACFPLLRTRLCFYTTWLSNFKKAIPLCISVEWLSRMLSYWRLSGFLMCFFYGALTTVFCIDFSLLKSCKNTHCSPKNKIKTKKPTPKHPTPNKTSKTPLPKLQRYCEVKEVIWSSVVYHPPPMELKVFKKHCLTVLSWDW